jgi:hypothetical protein
MATKLKPLTPRQASKLVYMTGGLGPPYTITMPSILDPRILPFHPLRNLQFSDYRACRDVIGGVRAALLRGRP